MARLVLLLYAAARRRVVALHGKTHLAAVAELDGLLHETLAERAAPYHQTAVMVLYRSRHNLGRTRCHLVDKNRQRHIRERARAVAADYLLLRVASARRDNRFVPRQEFIRHQHCRLHVPARISAQVHNHRFGPICHQIEHSVHKLAIGVLAETADAHISRILVGHKVSVHRRYRYVAARNIIFESLARCRRAYHRQLHLRVLRTLQKRRDRVYRHILTRDIAAVDSYYAVARVQPRLLRRAAHDNLHDIYGVAVHMIADADASERAAQRLVGLFKVLGGDIGRVRVKISQYAGQRFFDKRVQVDLVNVMLLNQRQQLVELFDSRKRLLLGRQKDTQPHTCRKHQCADKWSPIFYTLEFLHYAY